MAAPAHDGAGCSATPAAAPPSTDATTLGSNVELEWGDGSLADFVIEKAIGRGHFSVVHRATRKSDEMRVALKKVSIFDTMDAKARDRCLKEVKLLQTLPVHPCIIRYLDSFIDSNELYIVFEWAEHGDLRRLLKRAQESNTSLQEPQIWRYFVQICDAIRHMHDARVMHRDIKPANIFLAAHGRVKLGDLGLGRAFSSQTYEALSKVGTPLYMSPEVLDGRGYEWKSDVWSLGCLLYELASLRSPFKAEGDNLYMLFKKISVGTFAQLPRNFSQQLSQLVNSMIRVDPAQRPDARTALRAATKALAAFDNAAQPGGGADADGAGGGGGSGGGGAGDGGARAASDACFIVMDAVADKLKLLQYESGLLRARGLPPLPRGYFCSATLWPVPAQFGYLFQLVCWLLHVSVAPQHALWPLLPAAGASSYDTDAHAAATALLEQLRGCGPSLAPYGQLAPHKLCGARGADICALLNALTDVALSTQGFAWAQPAHGAAAGGGAAAEGDAEGDGLIEDVEGDDADEATAAWRGGGGGGGGGAAGGGGGDGGDDDSAAAGDGDGATSEATTGGGDGPLLLPLLWSDVDAARWRDESARIAPSLVLKVGWQQLHWRHRLAMARQHAPAFAEGTPRLDPGLEQVWRRAEQEVQRAAPLRDKQGELDAALREKQQLVAEAQQQLDARAATLHALERDAADAKAAAEAKGREIADATPLQSIRGALRALKLETRQLLLREALLRQQCFRKLGHGAPPPAAAAAMRALDDSVDEL